MSFGMNLQNQNMMKKQSCVIWIQTVSLYTQKHGIYKDIAKDAESRFDTSNYELECHSIDKLLPKRKKMKK